MTKNLGNSFFPPPGGWQAEAERLLGKLTDVKAKLAAVEIALARIEHSGGVNSLAFVEQVRAAMNGEEQA